MLRSIFPVIHNAGRTLACHRYISSGQSLQFLLKYMHKVANEVDVERRRQFGVERVCAEWILRNGGRIRFMESKDWLSDYNSLPPEEDSESYHIRDIDASGTEIMFNGFLHLEGMKHVESIKIHDGRYVDDNCLFLVKSVASSLRRLQISSCSGITDDGLKRLRGFSLLEELYLKDLLSVKDKVKAYEDLKLCLPKCYISYPDAEELLSNKKYE